MGTTFHIVASHGCHPLEGACQAGNAPPKKVPGTQFQLEL